MHKYFLSIALLASVSLFATNEKSNTFAKSKKLETIKKIVNGFRGKKETCYFTIDKTTYQYEKPISFNKMFQEWRDSKSQVKN